MKEILSVCDHTLLLQGSTWDEIKGICDDAMKYETASVCIPPCYVKKAAEYMAGKIPVCTVIGFPNGNMTTKTKVFETKDAIENGADEIDMVINIGMLKAKEYDYVLNEIKEIKSACGDKILKVIIETCLLTDDEKIKMCEIVTESGADFIKTSTGFSTGGATFDDVELFAKHVGENVKIKAAGGIASTDDAKKFIELGANRLGTSRIVKIAKSLLLAVIVAGSLCITGCGGNGLSSSTEIVNREDVEKKEQEENETPEEKEERNEEELKKENKPEQSVQMFNPLKEVTKEELQDETGIIIDAPYGVEGAKFFVLENGEAKTAQVIFNVGDYELTYRAEATDLTEAYDTTGLYYTWDEEKEKEVGHCKANLMVCDEASGIYWLDIETGINYSLSCVSDIDEGQFVGLANLCYTATNGDIRDNVMADPVDYEGEYENENGDTVSIIRKEDGSYEIAITILRLCFMEGTANDMDASAEFVVEDPNGGEMTGNFHTDEDDTYSFVITGSTWDYIKEQDVFTGFKLK